MYNYAHFLLIFSFLFAAITAFLIFKHSTGKHRSLLFFLTVLGCLVTVYSAWQSLKENQERNAELKSYKDGDPVIPYVGLELTRDKQSWVFSLFNNSKKYSIYKMKVWGTQVSTDQIFIYDPDKPPVILVDSFLQPTSHVDTYLEYDDIEINKNSPEMRFNFAIQCRHGFFAQQLILRIVKGKYYQAIRIFKDGKVVYKSPPDLEILLPNEEQLTFQSPEEGFIKGSKKEEFNKWKTRTKYYQY